MELWPDGIPDKYEMPENRFGDYSIPKVTIYPARNPTGLCVVECPGGGYYMLSDSHEGHGFADWFNARGITYVVVSYRMPCGHDKAPMTDVERAIQIVKGKAAELGIKKIGVMGCSAGGHLASTIATHYPVITMDKALTHAGSREGLLGENPSEDLVKLYSNELQVTKETCPAFIVLAMDDFTVKPENSFRYMNALINAGVKGNQMLVFPTGGHGFGVNDSYIYKSQWSTALDAWLQTINK